MRSFPKHNIIAAAAGTNAIAQNNGSTARSFSLQLIDVYIRKIEK